jgi:hypothetical protein
LNFSFLFALYEGGSGNPATSNDCEAYAKGIGSPSFPVFADGNSTIAGATPMSQKTHPEMCALTPELKILNCYSGHKAYLTALNDIKSHAGL